MSDHEHLSREQLIERCKRFESTLDRCREGVQKYTEGRPLTTEETYIERLLYEHREREEKQRATLFAASGKQMPPLSVRSGSSGLEIRALLDAPYNCAEFTTKAQTFQPILISPWIQFEPSDLSDGRLRITMEIARRAMCYDAMVERVISMEKLVKHWSGVEDKLVEERNKLVESWRAERVKYGKKADFSDLEPQCSSDSTSGS